MRKKIKPIYDKLLEIEFDILATVELLGDYSIDNKENDFGFQIYIERLDNLFKNERKLINGLDEITISELEEELYDLKDANQTFERMLNVVSNRRDYLEYSKIPDKENYQDEEEYDDENNIDLDDDFDDIDSNQGICLDDYYDDYDKYLDKYYDFAMTSIYIKMLKEIKNYIKILSEIANNKQDKEFVIALNKYYQAYKYYWFLRNNTSEDIGILYKFNIDNIPYLSEPIDELEPVLYNECIDTIDYILSIDNDNTVENVATGLFHQKIIFILLEYLTSEHREKIEEFLDEYNKKNKFNKYTNIINDSIKKKVRE